MKHLLFATHNSHKVTEVKSLLQGNFRVLSLDEAGIFTEIPEPFNSLEENAVEKARVIYRMTGKNCFSEDTGLETEALNGEPGVRSARYAGPERSFEKNREKLLEKLKNVHNRSARFRTVICLIINGEEKIFEGICKGSIIATQRGAGGFGYDAVFIPDGANKTFAEMSLREKNEFSHRRKAMEQLITFLGTL